MIPAESRNNTIQSTDYIQHIQTYQICEAKTDILNSFYTSNSKIHLMWPLLLPSSCSRTCHLVPFKSIQIRGVVITEGGHIIGVLQISLNLKYSLFAFVPLGLWDGFSKFLMEVLAAQIVLSVVCNKTI